jgi:flagellar hook-associated protein 3 FlgL
MIHRGVLSDLNDIATKLSQTQTKLATGKQISKPSDDPYGTGRALSLQGELDGLNQYRSNAADAQAWTSATDTALGSIGDAAQRARELLLQGANGTTSQKDRNSIADEIDQLTAAVKDDANASEGGRYLFSGTATSTKPYNPGSDAYNGDAGDVVRSIGPGVAVAVNARASDVIGNGTDGKLLQSLRDIATHLRGGTAADLTALGGTDIKALDGSIDTVLDARAQVGATANRVTSADDRLADLTLGVQSLLYKTEDADMAATITDYSMQQSVYQSALRAGAGIVQSSLLDFLH